MRTRVKICGLTTSDDIANAVQCGADALGFNMFPASPRFVPEDDLAELTQKVPPFISKVGLFVNAEASKVEALARQARFDLLQFHGDESDDYCAQFGMPFIKVIRLSSDMALAEEIKKFPNSHGILVDAHDEVLFGGTGKTLDWSNLAEIDQPLILAGGLTADNVASAILQVKPFAVDVSSGVEVAKGVKDSKKIRDFMIAVRKADRPLSHNESQ
ncbi:MAG: phosphoribosylanthranilate isomerase [Pseudomonadales bacterium]|nr:phosphoribosylanthranilate isomerase [Pseudomonadales bacterium]